MAGVNKVIIVGNLGQDPEIKYTSGGDAVANFSVATSESWKDKAGNKQERTEWHRCVAWRKLAEIIQQYVRKGSKIYIEGKLQTRKWQGSDGQDRYTTEIVVDQMQMLDGKSGGQSQQSAPRQQQPGRMDAQNRASMAAQAPSDFSDDIPFMAHHRGMENLA